MILEPRNVFESDFVGLKRVLSLKSGFEGVLGVQDTKFRIANFAIGQQKSPDLCRGRKNFKQLLLDELRSADFVRIVINVEGRGCKFFKRN